MYFAASLFAALVITLLLVSKIAKMLSAKRFDLGWIFFALVTGGILATISYFVLNEFIQLQDPKMILAIILIVSFIVSSAAYKFINQLNWSGAFTLNIASMAIGILTVVTAIVLNGKSINETFDTANLFAQNNASMLNMTETEDITESQEENGASNSTAENTSTGSDILASNEEPAITELDLLPAKVVRSMNREKKKVYIEPKFRVLSLGNIHSAVGHRIRIYRKNGNIINGALKGINGNDALVSRYLKKGTIMMPISIAKIHKMEVYK